MHIRFGLTAVAGLFALATFTTYGGGGGIDTSDIDTSGWPPPRNVPPATNMPRFAYVANYFDRSISIYSVNAATAIVTTGTIE